MESRTGQGQDITPRSGGGVLLTDITTVRAGSWGARQAGPAPAYLSLPFWMEAWPRLALSKSGEFLLRFVLVERTLFCGEQRAGLCHRKPVLYGRVRAPAPLPPSTTKGRGGEERTLL